MILAGAPEENVTVFDTNNVETIFSKLDEIDASVVYILTNTKHAPEIKQYFQKGGVSHA
jgi:putative heme iron utilization protein